MLRNIQLRRMVLGLAMAVTGLSASIASAQTITVQDPSFETLGDWGPSGTWASFNSVWQANFYPYNRTFDSSFFTSAADGTWFANLTDPGDTITQDLQTSVTAGNTLSVTFSAGRELSNAGGTFLATFLVGSTPYSQTIDTTGLTLGQWQSYTLTQTVGNSGTLSLQFSQVTGRPWLDNISNVTDTQAIPEPSSLVLVALGGLVMCRYVVRRKRAAVPQS